MFRRTATASLSLATALLASMGARFNGTFIPTLLEGGASQSPYTAGSTRKTAAHARRRERFNQAIDRDLYISGHADGRHRPSGTKLTRKAHIGSVGRKPGGFRVMSGRLVY